MIAARGSSNNAGTYAKYLFQVFRPSRGHGHAVLYTFYHNPPGCRRPRAGHLPVRAVRGHRRGHGRCAQPGSLTAAITADRTSPMAAQYTVAEDPPRKSRRGHQDLHLLPGAPRGAIFGLEGGKDRRPALSRLPASPENAGVRPGARGSPSACVSVDATLRRHRPGFLLRDCDGGCAEAQGAHLYHGGAYSSADFLHGPMAMVEAGFPVVVLGAGVLQAHM